MFKTKPILFISFCLFILSCHTGNVTGNVHDPGKYFSFVTATSESWSSPRPGGEKGTEYYFTIRMNTAEKVTFDSVWMENTSYPVFTIKKGAPVSNDPLTYAIGDTLVLRTSERYASTPQVKPPFQFTGEALIRYEAENAKQYFIVPAITKVNTPPRQ